jgi:hypothetical protein
MAAPNLSITVEPVETGNVVYLPLAAGTANNEPNAQLSLKLSIKNNESETVKVKSLTVGFPGSTVPSTTVPVQFTRKKPDGSVETTDELVAGETRAWFFQPTNNIVLPLPSPASVSIALSCNGFADPASLALALAPYKSPVAGESHRFPARASDLRAGEFWTGVGVKHAAAGGWQPALRL